MSLRYVILLTLVFSLVFKTLFSQTPNSTGFGPYFIEIEAPEKLCPSGTYTFIARAKNRLTGLPVFGCFQWGLAEGNEILLFPNCVSGFENTSSSSEFTVTLKYDLDSVRVGVSFRALNQTLSGNTFHGRKSIYPPGNLTPLDGTDLALAFGQIKAFKIDGVPVFPYTSLLQENCFWHHRWLFEFNNIFMIRNHNSQEPFNERLRTFGQTVDIRAPNSGTKGFYQLYVGADLLPPFNVNQTYNIWLGTPSPTNQNIQIIDARECNQWWSLNIPEVPGTTQYEWRCVGDSDFPQYGQSIEVSTVGFTGQSKLVQVFAKNSAGEIFVSQLSINLQNWEPCFPDGGCEGFICMQAYPNPSNGAFTIEISDQENIKAFREVYYEITIFKKNTEIVSKFQTKQDSFSLDLSKYGKGEYQIHISNGRSKVFKRVLVE